MSYEIGYFIKKGNRSIHDAIWFCIADSLENPKRFAELAAEYIWAQRDDLVVPTHYSFVLTLVSKGHETYLIPSVIGDFEITLETRPVFYAHEVK